MGTGLRLGDEKCICRYGQGRNVKSLFLFLRVFRGLVVND